MRCSVRLSVIEFMQESGLQRCLIHNYGHSGSGVTVVMTGYTHTDVGCTIPNEAKAPC